MKKVICFVLAISVILSAAMPVLAREADNPQYGVLNVEYSDALGDIEQLPAMVSNGYVYADAAVLSERLGYRCQQSGELVSIFAENNFLNTKAPLLAIHFHVNKTKVAYNPLFGAEFEYDTPAPCIVNEQGIWVPLRYTLVLLGANSTMVEDTLLLQIPQNNVLSTAAMIINNEDNLSFDWTKDFGYSETAINVADGAARIVTLFSGLLEFDGAAWLSLIDWNAFNRKFGELLVTMCSTYSSEEFEEVVSQVETSLEVFSDDGKLGEILRKKQYIIDADVSEWGKECEKYLEMLEAGSGSPAKYNLLYQRYEKAMNQQELFATLGGDNMRYLQTELTSATNVLDIAAILGSVVSYLNEFQQKDEYLFSSLKDYLNHRIETDYVPNATVQAMHHYLNVMDLGALGTSAYRFVEENWLKCIVDESGIDTLLGAPANVLLFAWDIMSATMPFYSKGLSAVESREISNYAQKIQNDALQNIKYLISRLSKSSSISAEDSAQLAEYCYVYLKASYIARDAAIKSLGSTSEEFQEQVEGKLEAESQINRFVANNLAVLSNANLKNDCYILGFLTENNSEYLDEYSDIKLLEAIHENDANCQKKLQEVNVTYSDGSKGQTVFKYNSSGLLTSSVFTSPYSDGSQETVYSYDSDNRLTAVQLTGDHWHAGFPSAEYDYDANGYLIRSAGGEGSIIEYLYENDSAGRPIKVTMNSDFQTTVSNYTYSESGNTAEISISVTDYQGNKSQGYASYECTYDAQGRIQTEARNGTDGSYNRNYIYDYFPFVCVASGNSTLHSIYLADIKGHPIWEIENVVVKSMQQDADGYLTQLIADSGAIYEFVYDKSNETDADLLISESQHELNTFLSYFSQQWFNEVDPKTYQVKIDSFAVQNADPAQLIRFVDLYTKINNSQVWYDSLDQDSKVHLSLDYVNGKLQHFLGVTISAQDVQKSGYELRDGNIYFDFAMGETYNYMTVARSWDEVSNGTFYVEFDIYCGEGKYRYAGGPIVAEDVYRYSTEDAKQDADLIYYKSGTATVRKTGNGNDATYQLIQYALEGQTQNTEKISFGDIPAEYTFTSGVGGWSTGLKIGTDGYFEGQYHDSNMGETGDGYPKGTVYYCNFSGKFSEPEPVNEYTYKVSLEQFSVADQTGMEYIENEIKYIASDPYGFDGPDEYYIYLPGIPSTMMPQNAFDWVSRLYGSNFGSYEVYVICSANGEFPFVGEFD